MNITLIKQAIAAQTGKPVVTLQFSRQFEDKECTKPTEWLQHWDNIDRFRVVVHQDLLAELKNNPTMDGLAYKAERVTPETKDGEEPKATYLRFILIKPKHVEAAF